MMSWVEQYAHFLAFEPSICTYVVGIVARFEPASDFVKGSACGFVEWIAVHARTDARERDTLGANVFGLLQAFSVCTPE